MTTGFDGSPEMRAARWAAGSATGTSSKALLGVMLGRPPKTRFCYPHDGDDLGRCIGLLDAVPEYRARLSEAAGMGPEWAALVERWGELEEMWRANDKRRLYDRMKEILDPIEATNPKLVKVGGGAIYFGD